MKRTGLFAAGILILVLPAAAADLQIELDPEGTSITFVLKATLHSVHGTAEPVSGSLRLDTETGVMEGEVAVDATTAATGIKKRDKKMHAKVLRTTDHPRIVLRARRLEGEVLLEGTSQTILHGELEILGQPHEITAPLNIEIDGERFIAHAEFEVPYVEWGLNDPSTFVLRVAKVVRVTVDSEGTVVGGGLP